MNPGYERAILYFDIDTFFASVERLHNRQLIGKPLLVGGTSSRGAVLSCSYEARAFGVRPGMPMKQALFWCPGAVVIRGDLETYQRHSTLVREIIAEEAPMYEQAALDEFYLDLTGMDRYIGCWKWSNQLRQRIMRESGLPLSLGLAVNKTVSKVVGREARPNGARSVPTGEERAFLAPLPVRRLPAVDWQTARHLALMGVRTCRTLSAIPPQLLLWEFGADGILLWKKANGEDDTPVVPYETPEALSAERVFDADTIALRVLTDELREQTAQLAAELRKMRKLASRITVKLRYADGNTFTRQSRIAHTCLNSTLTTKVLAIFEKLFERRQQVRLVGVRLEGLVSGGEQLTLFGDEERELRLRAAMG